MFGQEDHDRTEPATDYRREKARQRGQVAYSRELSGAVALLAAVLGAWQFGPALWNASLERFGQTWKEPWLELDARQAGKISAGLLSDALLESAGWWCLLIGAAGVVGVLQLGGIVLARDKPLVSLEALHPGQGLARLFKPRDLLTSFVDFLKVLVLITLLLVFLYLNVPVTLPWTNGEVGPITWVAGRQTFQFLLQLTIVLTLFGFGDFLLQRWKWERGLRMTKAEIKEEIREMEGDPAIKAKRRQAQMQLARSRSTAKVKEADVVITNPTELAVAVRFRLGEMDAPKVVAKGAGLFAKRIRELAAEHKIPIVENKPLARLLYFKADIDRPAPQESFVALAEILAYIYRMAGRPIPKR